MKHLTIVLVLLVQVCMAQKSKQDSLWKPMSFFVGEWTGQGEGEPGKGTYERTYRWVLGNKYIELKNRTVYLPTSANPKGEIHEDAGYISYDRGKKKFVMRQFHIEGFVNTYVLDSQSADGKTLVFITEQIENIPAGWRARETYSITGTNEFTETFELAEPNKDFAVYTRATFRRK